jgi:hypothetical protein
MKPVVCWTAKIWWDVGMVTSLRTYRRPDRKATLPGMAKRKGRVGTLTRRGRGVLAFVFNSIAFKSHDQNCDVETLAAHLRTKPGTLACSNLLVGALRWAELAQPDPP